MPSWGTIQLAYISHAAEDIKLIAARHQPIYAKFKAFRSEIIEAALFIESRLELLLCRLYVGEDPQRELLFRSSVLDPESGTFMRKWQMLREAFAILGVPGSCLDEKGRKQLFTELKQLISDRNKFAHGDLYIDARDGRPLLQYYEGVKKEDYLEDATIHQILKCAESLHRSIERVISAVK